jgi:MYXO-CTERM domain-containing protein
LTLPAVTGAGDTLVLGLAWVSADGGVPSVGDNQGNVYQVAVSPTPVPWDTSWIQTLQYVENLGPATVPTTVTVDLPGALSLTIYLAEYSGVQAQSPLGSTATGSSSSAAQMSTSTVDLSVPGELVVGYGLCAGSIASAGTGFTFADNSLGDLYEDLVAPSAGPMSATGTCSAGTWQMVMATFFPGDGGVDTGADGGGPLSDGGLGDNESGAGPPGGHLVPGLYRVGCSCSSPASGAGTVAGLLTAGLFLLLRRPRSGHH